MKARSIVVSTICLVLVSLSVFAVFTTTVRAQEEGVTEEVSMFDLRGITRDIILVVVFSVVGLIILMVGYKVFDMATPYDLNKQIAEENNVAAGVAVAGVIISLGIIVMAAMG